MKRNRLSYLALSGCRFFGFILCWGILSFLIYLIIPTSVVNGQQDSVWINLLEMSVQRKGLSLQPQATIRWRAWLKEANSPDWEDLPDSGQIRYIVKIKGDLPKILPLSDTTQKCFWIFENGIKWDHTYHVNISAMDSTAAHAIALTDTTTNTGSFHVQRNRRDNWIVNTIESILKFFYTKLIADLLASPFLGWTFLIVFLIFVITILSNLVVMGARLYLRPWGIAGTKRLFPRNKKLNLLSELKRLLTFRGYGDQVEFVLALRKRCGSVLDLETTIRDQGQDSMLAEIISHVIRMYKTYNAIWARHRYRDLFMRKELNDIYSLLSGRGNPRTRFFSLDMFWIIGTIGPLLGLLGTVIGISGAFSSLRFIPAMEKANIPAHLASNIKLALQTTILGLIIGISSIALYYYFKSQIESFIREASRILDDIIVKLP